MLGRSATWGCEIPTLPFSVRSRWQSCGYRSRLGAWKRRALHNQAERLVTAETEWAREIGRVGGEEAHTSKVFIAKNNVELLRDEKDPNGEEVWDGAPNLYLGFDRSHMYTKPSWSLLTPDYWWSQTIFQAFLIIQFLSFSESILLGYNTKTTKAYVHRHFLLCFCFYW